MSFEDLMAGTPDDALETGVQKEEDLTAEEVTDLAESMGINLPDDSGEMPMAA